MFYSSIEVLLASQAGTDLAGWTLRWSCREGRATLTAEAIVLDK
jgi:hypothetical protein